MEELRILLIEREAGDVDLFTLALQQAGLKVRLFRVAEVKAAMDYICGKGIYEDRQKYQFPDIVVLALLLPIASGLDFLKWCRATEICKELPLVVWTGGLEYQKEIQEALQYMPDRFYFKSGKLDVLTKTVREIYDLGMARRGASSGERFPIS